MDLQRRASRNNDAVGVTGILLVGGGYFLQLMEGRREAVASTLGRVAMDSRHEKMTVLLSQSVEHRRTGHWNMGVLDARVSEPRVDVRELAREIERRAHAGDGACSADGLFRAFEQRMGMAHVGQSRGSVI